MSLLKFFQPFPVLPKPQGPLSKVMPSSSIAAVNEEVKRVLEKKSDPGGNPATKRSPYQHFTPEEKLLIGKRAAECGVTSSIRYFSGVSQFRGRQLKESSVRGWKTTYLKEISARKRIGMDLNIARLPNKKTGRPLLLGKDLDRQVQSYIRETMEL